MTAALLIFLLNGLRLTESTLFSREYASNELTLAPVYPVLQPLLSTRIPPTRSMCVDMHPPLDYGEDSTLPMVQAVNARWLVPTCLTVFVYTKNSTFDPYQGLVVQVRANNTPIGRFQQTTFCKLVDCPPGKENTIVVWFNEPSLIYTVDWRTPLDFDNTTLYTLDVHVTIIRKPGVYWRIVVNPTPFKQFTNLPFPNEPDLTYELYTTEYPLPNRFLDDVE